MPRKVNVGTLRDKKKKKMAHNLHIGQKFEDFAAFESAIMRYQNAENVQFYRLDSRSLDKAKPRLEKKLNPKI